MRIVKLISFRLRNKITPLFFIGLFFVLASPIALAQQTALSMHGEPKYAKNFKQFSYVDPTAKKGGVLRLSAIGGFDSLNPFLIRGVPAKGLGLVFQSLLSRSKDEPFALYANIAKSFEIAPDRRWITFKLDSRAKFSSGAPVKAEDVLFSFETLRTKGRPNHRQYYNQVAKAEIINENQIRFTFSGSNVWELPLIMGLMPILSRNAYAELQFDKTTLVPPIGSGPYKIAKIDPGRQVIYQRDPKFWGWHLPQFKGRHNFDQIRFDYFRDTDIALEAFKSGSIDARFETDPGKWVTGNNNAPSVNWTKEVRHQKTPPPMLALAFNTRRALFNSRNVRIALTHAFDFEWLNKNLLHGAYTRPQSYFQDTPLGATGLPNHDEIQLLTPFKSELPNDIFNKPFTLPVSDGSGRDRRQLKTAKKLLEKEGWVLANGLRTHQKTGDQFKFEILVVNNRDLKLLSSFQKNLKRLGIIASIRLLDTASYQNRINDYDFDMMITEWGQSLSPGNEQSFYWSSQAALTPGTRNYPGINLRSVDHLSTAIATAKSRKELETATRALDRILLWGIYAIPLYHTNEQWLMRWPQVRLPKIDSYYGTTPDLWWHSPIDVPPSKKS